MELGAGSCGFSRRSWEFIQDGLSEYYLTDITVIRQHELAGNPKVKTAKHDLNKPVNLALMGNMPFDVVVASNVVHVGSDIRSVLAHAADALAPGGFIILEEYVGDASLYIWGLDKFIWTTATDNRSFGLWMSTEEWKEMVHTLPDALEFVLARQGPGCVYSFSERRERQSRRPSLMKACS
jgi:SAM-dependent methyltransferase